MKLQKANQTKKQFRLTMTDRIFIEQIAIDLGVSESQIVNWAIDNLKHLISNRERRGLPVFVPSSLCLSFLLLYMINQFYLQHQQNAMLLMGHLLLFQNLCNQIQYHPDILLNI